MANLTESSIWETGVYQLETTDPVLGGPSGVSNLPLKHLANRTVFLKGAVDALTAGKAPLASPALTGSPTAPTAAPGTSTTQLATTAFVLTAVATAVGALVTSVAGKTGAVSLVVSDVGGAAPLASPAFSGVPTAPTAAPGNNTTQLATTAFVQAATTMAAPSAMVAHFARQTPPAGWLKADGSAVSRTFFAALFSAIGTTFGPGDGSTTFNVPDLRGEFLRGWDDGRGVDAGRGIGTAQGDAIRNIVGTLSSGGHIVFDEGTGALRPATTTNATGTTALTPNGQTDDFTFDASRVVPTASENRPRNVAMLACIKF